MWRCYLQPLALKWQKSWCSRWPSAGQKIGQIAKMKKKTERIAHMYPHIKFQWNSPSGFLCSWSASQTHARTDECKTVYPPNSVSGGIIMETYCKVPLVPFWKSRWQHWSSVDKSITADVLPPVMPQWDSRDFRYHDYRLTSLIEHICESLSRAKLPKPHPHLKTALGQLVWISSTVSFASNTIFYRNAFSQQILVSWTGLSDHNCRCWCIKSKCSPLMDRTDPS
jgi:hypothetical protein